MSAKIANDPTQASDAPLPPTRLFLRRLEEVAMELRRHAGVGPLGPLDPMLVQGQLGCTIITDEAIATLSSEMRSLVRRMTPQEWSGTGMPLPTGELLVLLNADQTVERARVTALEEVAHRHYGHEPSQITALPGGISSRTFNPRIEQEGYWTAAAALLPMKAVANAVWRKRSAEELATEYGVSIELAEFRIKILGLWNHYVRNAA